jgi:hypothetical protein
MNMNHSSLRTIVMATQIVFLSHPSVGCISPKETFNLSVSAAPIFSHQNSLVKIGAPVPFAKGTRIGPNLVLTAAHAFGPPVITRTIPKVWGKEEMLDVESFFNKNGSGMRIDGYDQPGGDIVVMKINDTIPNVQVPTLEEGNGLNPSDEVLIPAARNTPLKISEIYFTKTPRTFIQFHEDWSPQPGDTGSGVFKKMSDGNYRIVGVLSGISAGSTAIEILDPDYIREIIDDKIKPTDVKELKRRPDNKNPKKISCYHGIPIGPTNQRSTFIYIKNLKDNPKVELKFLNNKSFEVFKNIIRDYAEKWGNIRDIKIRPIGKAKIVVDGDLIEKLFSISPNLTSIYVEGEKKWNCMRPKGSNKFDCGLEST